jgi:hypothetical protein
VTRHHVGGVSSQGIGASGRQLAGSGARAIGRCGDASGHVDERPVIT